MQVALVTIIQGQRLSIFGIILNLIGSLNRCPRALQGPPPRPPPRPPPGRARNACGRDLIPDEYSPTRMLSPPATPGYAHPGYWPSPGRCHDSVNMIL